MSPGELRLVFVDLDDTLYDRTWLRPQALLKAAPPDHTTGIHRIRSIGNRLEAIREAGEVLEELGLPNVRHRTESPVLLAALVVLYGTPSSPGDGAPVTSALQRLLRRSLARARTTLGSVWNCTWKERLVRVLAFRRLRALDTSLQDLRGLLTSLSERDELTTLAASLKRQSSWQPYDEFGKTLSFFRRTGAATFIVSEGVEETQLEKLAHLGLSESFSTRLITSERAARPLDAARFRAANDRVLDELWMGDDALTERLRRIDFSDPREVDGVLALVPSDVQSSAVCRWLLDVFAWKSPPFYSRVVHAVVSDPSRPVAALDSLALLSPSEWGNQTVRLAMIGNSWHKDVEPLRQLLGEGVAWTAWLRIGRDRNRGPFGPGADPGLAFPSWPDLERYLVGGFSWERVRPISTAPPLADTRDIPPDLTRRARSSEFAVERALGAILSGEPAVR